MDANSVSLIKILAGLPEDVFVQKPVLEHGDVHIRGIALDSRQVKAGDLFVALSGGNRDGHDFILAAIKNGAAAVVGTKPRVDFVVPYVQVADSRKALAYLSAAFYGFPARRLTVIGVTGTDGKTTTSNYIYHILKAAGVRVGMISTVNALIGDQALDTGFHVTTPEAPDVQRYLALMVEAGVTHVVLESTSHGLDQHRVTACEYDIAIVTNITHEHLDYHGSYAAYREAKARLFMHLAETTSKPQGNPAAAILNADDQSVEYLRTVLKSIKRGREITSIEYGLSTAAQVRAALVRQDAHGLEFQASGPGWTVAVRTGLYGEYNVSNCLAALAATVGGLDIDPATAAEGIAAMPGIPGRMQRIDQGQDFLALVDFAHTPNALQRALSDARKLLADAQQNRVIAVFGSAGLRDRQKRRLMAQAALPLADISIFTAEDPRTESLDDILAEMAAGAVLVGGSEGQNYLKVRDRGAAIRLGVSLAAAGDVVILLGKGHEQSMCFGETEFPWDDRIALGAALAERLGQPGPQMPYLPTQEGE